MNPVGGRTRRAHNGRGKSLVAIAATMAVVASMAFTGVSLADDDPAGASTEAAATTPALDDLAVAVTSDPATGASVEAGATVSVTLALSNSSPFDLPAGTHVTSDVKDVLPAVELPADLAAAGLTLEGDVLTWTVPEVISSDSATTTFDLVAKAPVAAPRDDRRSCRGRRAVRRRNVCDVVQRDGSRVDRDDSHRDPGRADRGCGDDGGHEPTDGTEHERPTAPSHRCTGRRDPIDVRTRRPASCRSPREDVGRPDHRGTSRPDHRRDDRIRRSRRPPAPCPPARRRKARCKAAASSRKPKPTRTAR